VYIITKEFHLSYSHALLDMPEGHPCKRNHGHNAIVKVVLESSYLDNKSFVVDYGDLKPIGKFLDDNWDHKFLAKDEAQRDRYNIPPNESYILGFQSSAENLASFLYYQFKPQFSQLVEVHFSETPKTWAIFKQDKPYQWLPAITKEYFDFDRTVT